MRLLLLAAALNAVACPIYRSQATAECEDAAEETFLDPSTGHCLIFVASPRPWSSARLHCQVRVGADLVVISGQRENDAVTFLAEGREIWLGATDVDEEGVWRWVDGALLGVGPWSVGQPDDAHIGEDCLEMNRPSHLEGSWNDIACDISLPFVCERSALSVE